MPHAAPRVGHQRRVVVGLVFISVEYLCFQRLRCTAGQQAAPHEVYDLNHHHATRHAQLLKRKHLQERRRAPA